MVMPCCCSVVPMRPSMPTTPPYRSRPTIPIPSTTVRVPTSPSATPAEAKADFTAASNAKFNQPKARKLARGSARETQIATAMPKSWSEKFANPPKPSVSRLGKPYAGHAEGEKMLIPTPAAVAAYVETIPKGESRTAPQMREDLAAAHRAGLHLSAHGRHLPAHRRRAGLGAASERQGAHQDHPLLACDGCEITDAKKLACGVDFIAKQRRLEGLA
jgi:hypothetical protein